jgi:hypothetical protein
MSEETAETGETTETTETTGATETTGTTETTETKQSATGEHWLSGVEDPDLRGWAEAKGMQNVQPADVLRSYQNLEKVMGADKAGRTVVLPGPDADEATQNEFYAKLGRPDAADKYELPVPEGDTSDMAEWGSGVFFEAGLTARQAEIVATRWNEKMAGLKDQAAEANAATAQEAEQQLRRDWGAAYDKKMAGIDDAATRLGMNQEQLQGLRASMGPVAALKFVDGLAVKMGEADFDTGGDPQNGVLTPAAAQEALAKLNMDKDFMDAWLNKQHPSHEWAVTRKQSLAKMAAGQSA